MATAISASVERYPGSDAWSREARRLLALAAALDKTIDEQALTLCDVRDLQAMSIGLREHGRHRAPPGRTTVHSVAPAIRRQ